MRESRFIGKRLLVAAALVMAATTVAMAAKGAGGSIAARVGTKSITLEEVDKQAMAVDLKAYQGLYDTRKRVLDGMVADILLEQEAKARGISKDQLIKTEITDKTKPVSDEDIQKWYDANKARVRNQPLESLKPRIREFLEQQASAEAHNAFIDKLKQKTKVRLTLEPPRIEVKLAANDPTMGPAKAPVVMVEFSDFQ
jgi:hypothetical protein